MNAARDLLKLRDSISEARCDLQQLGTNVRQLERDVSLCRPHRKPERDQSLLRSVMKVSLDATASVIRRRNDSLPRCSKFRLALRVRDRGRNELGELLEAFGRIARQRLLRRD